MGPRKLSPGKDGASGSWRPERTRPSEAGAREREGPSRPRPWQAVAVAETAGYVGSVEGSSREGHGRVTDPSPMSHGVTKNVRSPHFRASSSAPAPGSSH